MKRKRSSTADGATKEPSKLVSPLLLSSPSRDSPLTKPYNFSSGLRSSSASMKKTKPPSLSPSSPLGRHRSLPQKTPATILDVKDLFATLTDSIKQQIDLSHAEILKEIDVSKSRLSKRFKMQSQACLHVTEEAEKEHKKLSGWINENMEVMKASFAEFITEAQASASRVCKGSIPDITMAMEKAVEELRCCYWFPYAAL